MPVGRELSVGFRHKLPFDMSHANVGNVQRSGVRFRRESTQFTSFPRDAESVSLRRHRSFQVHWALRSRPPTYRAFSIC